MSPVKPIGKNLIRKMLKDAAGMIGLSKAEDFGGHSLWAYLISKLSNDRGVNLTEAMAVAHHRSVSTHKSYIERGVESEVAVARALGHKV